MNYLLGIYSEKRYNELVLPAVDNADYECILFAEDYEIKDNLRIRFEVVDEQWRILQSPDYRMLKDGQEFADVVLLDGIRIQIQTNRKENLTVFVWEGAKELVPFRKYGILSDSISIGRSSHCDIYYTQQRFLAKEQATIYLQRDKAVLQDTSPNGTYVNGHRISSQTDLRFGDRINLYELTILYLGDLLAVGSIRGRVETHDDHLQELVRIHKSERTHDEPGSSETMVHIPPRTIQKLYDEPITIENVPAKREEDKRPAWMSILPSLTMILPMVMGTLLMGAVGIAGLVISAGSGVIGVVWGTINYRYAKKQERENERKRLGRYEEYLVRTADQIREEFEFNRKYMQDQYPSAEVCSKYKDTSKELWARKTSNSDFLFVRLGIGDLPFQVKINTTAPGFSLVDDELSERPSKIAQNYETLHEVPIGVNLKEHNVVGVLTGRSQEYRLQALEIIRTIVTQIAANHCYTDVKIAALYSSNLGTTDEWAFIRWLPHAWNKNQSIRFIASDEESINDVLYEIMQELRSRSEQISNNISGTHSSFIPHYVLLVESPELLESQMISKYIYRNGSQLGITTIILSEVYERLPNDCDIVIENSHSFQGIYSVKEEGEERSTIQFDHLSLEQAEQMARQMSGMRVKQMELSSNIPDSLTFFDMHGVSRLEDFNVLERWKKNKTYESMRALVGQKAGGQDCYLDINEKYHGPHGLVAGTTGSGKSETLQTYILSLAVNFSPMDVGLFIIDFKGGGMANLFSNIPHMLGQISNLSGNQVHRAMVSIKSENARRQRFFSEFGVNHIDAYTKLVKKKEATVPIPHLLIIIDEFAELKREEPDFMRELISVAQVGRSLGVHLILATQKPSGTVDDNIWSNTKFRLCLRVADKQDSNDMLHKPDAAFLTQAGRCYLQVGNDEIYELFQSGWSGATYSTQDPTNTGSAILLNLQGKSAISGAKVRARQRDAAARVWIEKIVSCAVTAMQMLQIDAQPCQLNRDQCAVMAKKTTELLNGLEDHHSSGTVNARQMEDMLRCWPKGEQNVSVVAEHIIERFKAAEKKLPEPKELTQLEAVVDYLADVAKANGYENKQKLWMPVLPETLFLEQLDGYQESAYQDGSWMPHEDGFQLSAYMGLVDDPENQLQFPLKIDLASNGHLTVVGSVTSGKSTFLQTLTFSLANTYSPAEVNFYMIDFSSQMLAPFEHDAHVGGVILEGEDDKLNKFFGMVTVELQRRKKQIVGGSFSQYVRKNGMTMPAIVIMIDGYSNFRAKTEDRFENNLMELAGTAEGYGIYLVISAGTIGGSELQAKIADYMRQGICLEMTDKYSYSDALKTTGITVLPENNVKGRGLAVVDGNVLEYQTALCIAAENDYERADKIRSICKDMTEKWDGKTAMPIPEIPDKPTWRLYRSLEQYQQMLQSKDYIPVGYKEEDASLYAIDLRKTFSYLVIGREKSGKTFYLRNVLCAAVDMGAKVTLVDTASGEEAETARTLGIPCVSDAQGYIELYKDLIGATNERAQRRKELESQGLEDEEIYAGMKVFPPIVYVIEDLLEFVETIYVDVGGVGPLNAGFETVINKGRLLNVYFIAAATTADIYELAGYQFYNSFIRDKNGAVLGGELGSQNVFAYQNISYNDQTKQLKPGMGYVADPDDHQRMDLIVIPQNRKVTSV